MQLYSTSYFRLCQRLLRPREFNFFFKCLIRHIFPVSTTQEAPEHQFLVDLSKNLVKTGLYFVSIPKGWPCRGHTDSDSNFIQLKLKVTKILINGWKKHLTDLSAILCKMRQLRSSQAISTDNGFILKKTNQNMKQKMKSHKPFQSYLPANWPGWFSQKGWPVSM